VLTLLGGYVAAAALTSFIGWPANLPGLTDWGDSGLSIQPNAAIAAAAAGFALLSIAAGYERVAMLASAVAAAIGAATLFEHLTGVDLGIDRLLMFDRPWGRRGTLEPGRMGPLGSISWTTIGAALLLRNGGPWGRRGHLFGAASLYAVPTITVIAFQTATMVLASAVGILVALPDQQPMRRLLDPSAAGLLVRRLLPLIVTIPIVLGFLLVRGQTAGFYDPAMGTAILVLLVIALLGGVVWRGASAVHVYEERLRKSVRELEAVFRTAPVGLAVARGREGEQIDVNEAFDAMLGLDASGGVSRTSPHGGSPPRITDTTGTAIAQANLPLQAAARTGQTLLNQTLIVHRPDGHRIILCSAVPVTTGAGDPHGAIAVFVDVTAERTAASDRERLLALADAARADAELASRAKDEFLAILSHELRSPLNAMLGWLQIMKRPGVDAGLTSRAMETLERNLRTQAQIISDLLDVSRITSGKFEMDHGRVDMTAVVLAAVESLRPMAEGKALRVDLDVAEGPLLVDGDMSRLQQVVTNILHNAIKFTPEGGRISLAARATDGAIEVTTADGGQGIDGTVLPRIFDRFVQADSGTNRRHGGLGLGLAIVKQLVERHGGTVAAMSPGIGLGATFTVTLPAALPRQVGSTPSPTESLAGHVPAGLDVLVVEDDDDSREALVIGLGLWGATVREANSAAEAVAAYLADPPDVLVSDIGMPGEDGYALIRAIRDHDQRNGRHTLAIAMTGFASRVDREAALRAGFDVHVSKPVEIAALLRRIETLVASRSA
jgi:signal transduction histidine kinase/CheY-like chemotaxis protein